jgi:hypothetical protein
MPKDQGDRPDLPSKVVQVVLLQADALFRVAGNWAIQDPGACGMAIPKRS